MYKKCKFWKISELSSRYFLICIKRRFAVRRVLRTPLRLHMAKCFQVFYDLSFYVNTFARLENFFGQIADIDLLTWSKNPKNTKFQNCQNWVLDAFWYVSNVSLQFGECFAPPLCLHMAECFQVFYDLSFYVSSFARFGNFSGQIADIDLATWSKNVKKLKFFEIIRIKL